MEDPRLDSGTLYCIDSESGERLWQRDSVPSVMPKVHGDPVNLLVFWSWHNPGYYTEQRIGGVRRNPQRSLQLTVVDAESGKTVAEGRHLSPAEPVRCVHNAARKVIEVHTEKSLITISYSQSSKEK